MTVSAPRAIDVRLRQEFWDNKLETNSVPPDIMSSLTTVFDEEDDIIVPEDALVLQANLPTNGKRTYNFGFIDVLNQVGGEGDLFVQIGNEEPLRTKQFECQYNEFMHAVTGFNYGMSAHEAMPYRIYDESMDKGTELLGIHAQEKRGLYRRQALLERVSQNLTASPIFGTQSWNPHWYVKNLFNTQQPVYDPNNATFTNSIATALNAAGTTVNAALDAQYMLALSLRAKQLRINPLRIGGKWRYILTVPSEQLVWFKSLDIPGSGGEWMSQYTAKRDLGIDFPGLIGEWENILIVEDDRAPTLTVGGSAAPFTLTANYLFPGNNDQRDETAGARQVGFLLGRGPLVEPYPEKIHHEYDDFNYRKWIGKGYFGMIGDTLRVYDEPTPTATSFEQHSSIVCVFARNAMYN